MTVQLFSHSQILLSVLSPTCPAGQSSHFPLFRDMLLRTRRLQQRFRSESRDVPPLLRHVFLRQASAEL